MTGLLERAITCLVAALVLLALALPHAAGSGASAADDSVIEVFVIPHTHDDVGWLLSVDQYYIRQVQWILDSCIQQLLDNPERKFTYVEMAYFQRWWDRLPESRREQVRTLYRRGQLEFNLGGIAMNDEGVTTYYEEINQMSHGAAFLEKELGAHARSAWHIDPFGHSAATASLWADVGFDGFVLNRIPLDIKDRWKADKRLEFVWRPADGKEIWVHVLDTWYSSPSECAFNNDDGWNGVYIQDDPRIFDENVDQMVNNFVKMAKNRAQYYRHNKLLVPFGDDFAHREAFTSFVQMDKLIKYVNQNTARTGVKARYAFLSDYVAAVNTLNLTWPVYNGDFFPYADGTSNGSYWSGYFTSRVALKGYVRQSDSLLHAGELLFTLFKDSALLPNEQARIKANSQLEVLRQATSVATHHDAVTGTEKTAVAVDYTVRLDMGNKAVNDFITNTIARSQKPTGPATSADASDAATTTVVTLFNPLGWARKEMMRIPVATSNVKVVDAASGQPVASQANPIPAYSLDAGSAAYNLFFMVELQPLELRTFHIVALARDDDDAGRAHLGIPVPRSAVSSIENEFLRVNLDPSSNRIAAITNKKSGMSLRVEQDFLQYLPASGEEIQASGAYIFQPTSNSMYNAGGAQNSDLLVSTRHFPRPYDSNVPYILATPRGQDFNDTFAVSVRAVTVKDVTFNIYRVDNPNANPQGWDQSLQLDYLAFTSAADLPIAGSQFGTIDVGPSPRGSPVAQAVIKFSAGGFADVPRVMVTATGQDYDDAFATGVQLITPQFAVINVQRVNAGGWDQDVRLTWWAFSPSANASSPSSSNLPPVYPAFVSGSTAVPASPPSSGPSTVVIVDVVHPEFWRNPLILLSVRGGVKNNNNTWATTVRPIDGQRSFRVNIHSSAAGAGWAAGEVQLDWVLLRRDTIVERVAPSSGDGGGGGGVVQTVGYVGPLVEELQQAWRPGYAQTVRVFKASNGDALVGNWVELTEELGPIDPGTELVTRFATDLDSRLTSYTDDNALLVQRRVFNASKHDPVPANYYPMVARAFLRDEKKDAGARQLTLVSDRAHGAASLNAGELEVMLDRRCVSDDGRGVGETLDDRNRTQQALRLVFDGVQASTQLHRKLAILQQFPVHQALYAQPTTTTVLAGNVGRFGAQQRQLNGLNGELPYNVHLLSLYTQDYFNFTQFSAHPSAFARKNNDKSDNNNNEAVTTSRVLVRLQHIFEAGESPQYSVPVEVDLASLLRLQGWTLKTITEMNLTGNRVKADLRRLQWHTAGVQEEGEDERAARHQQHHHPQNQATGSASPEAAVVTLLPSEIRTFLFEFVATS